MEIYKQRLEEEFKNKQPHLVEKKVLFYHNNALIHNSPNAMSKVNE